MAIKTVQVIINGVTSDLSLNSSTGLYEGEVVAPSKSSFNQSKKYYPITVKATDDAGNSIFKDDTDTEMGTSLQLTVKETTKPVITVISPTDDSHITDNAPTISWKVTDDDSGVNGETIGITVDSKEQTTNGIIKTPITGGVECSYTVPNALSDGSHTFKFDAEDNDGNKAIQRTLNIVVDTIPPVLSIISPVNNFVTNNKTLTLSGETNDITSNPVTLKYSLNGEEEISVDVGENGLFSTILELKEGENTITITSTDKAGKSTSITRIVKLDTEAPVISEVFISPNPATTGNIVRISARVTD